MDSHVLINGKTGSGKSEYQLRAAKAIAREKRQAFLMLDPHGNLAKDFLMHLSAMYQLDRVLYDRLADTDRVLGYECLTPSTSEDPLQRFTENDEATRKFCAVLVRRQGAKDTSKNPMIEDGLFRAIRLFLNQDKPVPLHWLSQIYTYRSPVLAHLIEHCIDPATKQEAEGLLYLNPQTFDYKTGGADRRLKALLQTPSFAIRSVPSFDFDEFLKNKGILIVDGEGCNPDAASVMMSAINLRTIQSCRKFQYPTQTVTDEATNTGLFGLQEAQALAEVRKWNLGMTIMVQSLNFPDEEITKTVLQNTQKHIYFCQGSPEAARQAAADIATRILDPLKVHHTEYRVRQADDGYERVENSSSSVTKDKQGKKVSQSSTSNFSIVRKVKEVTDAQDRYTSYADQQKDVEKRLMELPVGWHWIAGESEPKYEPMEKHLWHHLSGILSGSISEAAIQKLKESKLRDAIARVKESPAYRKPFLEPLPSKPAQPPSAARRLKGKRGTN